MEAIMNQSRRTFLKTSGAAGGGLVIGFYLPGVARLAEAATTSAAPFAPNAWLKVGRDNSVTIIVAKSEMGQGVVTSMPMLVAEELEVDWAQVRFEMAPADPVYANSLLGGQITGGSTSVRSSWEPLRRAGAVARAMLITAAAQTWGVEPGGCYAENGEVISKSSGRRLRYGALVDKAATLPVPQQVSLKKPGNFRLIGKSLAGLDITEKVNGSARFGIDVKVPGMLIAKVSRCPVFGGKVASFNATQAKAVRGVRQVVQIDSGIAVVADSFWAATLGQRALEVTWDEGPNAGLNSADISRRFAELAQRPGAVARQEGAVSKVWPNAAKKLEAVYEVPYLAHATMEPMNCTAHVRRDGCDLWVPTQGQSGTQQRAAQITGLPLDAIKVHTTFLGGGFGRRGEVDFVAEAVQISKAIGAPVKVVWTREDDMQHDFYRPATYNRLSAALDEKGMPIAWTQRIICTSIFRRVLPDRIKDGIDPVSVGGAADLPYSIPNLYVDYIMHDPGIPVGFWRSVPHSVQGFVTECFFDEVATAGGKDPYELRRQLLDQAPRHKAVLELAATKAGWNQPLPAGRFQGIAVHGSYASFVAQVAEVSVSKGGNVRVHRVVCAIDCGPVVNPDTVKAQMEGGIVYGLTAALKGEITIRNGRVAQSNFHDYQMLRMNEMPEIEVHIVPSTNAIGGVGEPGTPPVAGAVVNAIFAATGKRIRRLPIRPEGLRTA